MAKLPFPQNPTSETSYYRTPSFRGGRMFLFTITRPDALSTPMYPYSLALYSNPNSVEESMNKTKNVTPTYGGFVEFIWPDDLTTVSCNASTGAFIGADVGLTGSSSSGVGNRRETVAYEVYQDLLELFRCNGMIFDGSGKPAIRGRVMMLYDRGAFLGHFTNFEVTESAEQPFSFSLSWNFRVESAVYKFPYKQQPPSAE